MSKKEIKTEVPKTESGRKVLGAALDAAGVLPYAGKSNEAQLNRAKSDGWTHVYISPNNPDYQSTLCGPTYSAETVTLGEMVERVASFVPTVKIKISDQYSAVINQDKSGVQVGCTFVSKETVKEIYDALQ